jgi:oxygen-independent coproporphyrinogen-3 oxidase
VVNSSPHPGLYIHVPFCSRKCGYCDFYSSTRLELIPRWLKAIKQEVLLYQDYFTPFDTLYLGGGTPSILPDEILNKLVESLNSTLSFAPSTERTIEANPDDLSLIKLRQFRELGFNRLSLGVQSFDDHILGFLRRRHTSQQAVQALEWAREAGFDNISLDLIYAIPGQNARDWHANLKQALNFKPEHLSCYQLTFEPATLFGQQLARNQLQPWDENNARLFFLETSLALADAGYIHYEISNFAKGLDHVSHHNMKYWQHTPYLGLGPAAHSFLPKKRWWNKRDLEAYCLLLDQQLSPVDESEILTEEQWNLESLYLGFRTTRGVDLELLKNNRNYEAIIGQLRESSLIKQQDGRIVPTLEGFAVADSLPLLFA